MAADNKTQIVISARDDTAAAFASAKSQLEQFTSSYAALGALVSTGVVGGLVATVKSAIDAGDQFNKLSQKTGIAVESLSALAYAGKLSDVSIEALATGIKKLSVNMNEAAVSTNGKAAEAFRALNVSVKDSAGVLRGSDAVLGDIADRFADMEDGAGKAALAVAIFGKAGTDLIPFLNQGSKGIAQLKAEAEKLGLVMTGEVAKAAEEFNDNLKKLTIGAEALGKSLTAELIGPMAELTKLMVQARMEGAGLFSSIAVGLRLGEPAKTSLDDMRTRAATLQGRISDATAPGGFNIKTRVAADRAELAVLQKQIAERQKQAEDFGPPVVAGAKNAAPTFGGKEGADREASFLLSLRQQLTAASGDTSEYSKVLLALTEGPQKEFSKQTKSSALSLAKEIDFLKANTQAHDLRGKVLEKISQAEAASIKTVSDVRAKQDQALSDIGSRIEALGKTPFEVKQIEALHRVDKEYEDAVRQINDELKKIGDVEPDSLQWARIDVITARRTELRADRTKSRADILKALEDEKVAQDAINASVEYGANESLRKYGEMVRDVGKATGDALTRGFSMAEDALVEFAMHGKLSFKNLIDYAEAEFLRLAFIRPGVNSVANAFKDSGGASGLLGSVKSLFGFASGGAFTVGGSGGTDSQLVAFKATPGEEVSIRTPMQQTGNGGITIQQHIYPSPGVSASDLMQAMVQAKNAAVAEISNSMRRGGSFA